MKTVKVFWQKEPMILEDWQDKIVRRVTENDKSVDGACLLRDGHLWANYWYDVEMKNGEWSLGDYRVEFGHKTTWDDSTWRDGV
jgi:hypothetical protein